MTGKFSFTLHQVVYSTLAANRRKGPSKLIKACPNAHPLAFLGSSLPAMGGFYQGKGGKGGAAAAPEPAAGGAADGLPGALKRKLQALGYPELGSVSLSGQAYMKVILWLEEEPFFSELSR